LVEQQALIRRPLMQAIIGVASGRVEDGCPRLD
jgi:hypothetical protein